jgi:hypothetical protein
VKTHSLLPGTLSLVSCLACLLLLVFALAGCASHPFGMSDEDWNQLTPEQKLEATKQDERNRLDRETLRRAEAQRAEEEQLQRDLAAGMIYQFSPDRAYCIGGDKCPRENFSELILSLQRLANVDRVVFCADDRIGRKHEGRISVYADDVLVAGSIDMKRKDTWYQVLVARPARNITLRAMGDDEVEIGQVKIYGSWAVGEQRYLIVK